MSFYRIQSAARPVAELLDETNWQSAAWFSSPVRDCRGCVDCEPEPVCRREQHATCGGTHEVEDVRYGISCCRSVDDLVDYLAQTGADLDDCVLVEMAGNISDDDDHDAELGAVLLLPTRICSVTPVGEELLDQIYSLAV